MNPFWEFAIGHAIYDGKGSDQRKGSHPFLYTRPSRLALALAFLLS